MSRARERQKRRRRAAWLEGRRVLPLETAEALALDRVVFGVATSEIAWKWNGQMYVPRVRRIDSRAAEMKKEGPITP